MQENGLKTKSHMYSQVIQFHYFIMAKNFQKEHFNYSKPKNS